VYPILYVDGIRIRVKDNGVVTIKVAYLAIGVDVDGRKRALGCWIQDTEGAKFGRRSCLICVIEASRTSSSPVVTA